ncbi:MAG: radical SAM protein [Clostridiales bacterium]|nr:radical SAM protein [Clostridiales bacterium]
MKKVYLVQASAVYGESVKSAYLPYAAGCLAAYAFADEAIRREYELGRFIFTREDIDTAVASLEDPYFVGFSSYVWNMEYNRRFARKLKEVYPDTIVAFGGHSVRPDGSDLDTIPEADIIMHGEGEEVFRSLLLTFASGGDLGEVNNISYRKNGVTVTTEYRVPPTIENYPSPYLEGYFDDIVKNSGITPSMIWETNRGCPNRCAFCDWGALKSRIRMFPDSRIRAEIDWMVRNRIEFVYCADANFGLFPRDEEITDMIIESNKKYGYPQVFKTNYTKNKDDVVFDISTKLMRSRIGKSPTLSFQSLSPEVLENIGRSNMELEHFKNLMTRYNESGTHVYSELILGLPGETYDSFADGICTLLDCNQHTAIGIYPCELLPNSLLGSKEYRERFDIRTVNTSFTQFHTKVEKKDVPEHSNVIISTSTMGIDGWKRSCIFAVFIQALHNLAMTRAVAIYLRKEKNVSYRDFYESLIDRCREQGENSVCGEAYRRISELVDGVIAGKNSFSCVYGEEEKLTWAFDEFLFIFLMKHADAFYRELEDFVGRFGADPDILGDLLLYQQEVMKRPGKNELSLTLSYDLYNYYKRIYTDRYAPPEKKTNLLYAVDRAAPSWDEWSRICVWYGRRDDAQLFTGRNNNVEQTFELPTGEDAQ